MEGTIDMHEGLAWMGTFDEGRDWLARLPGLVDACAEQWSLTLGEPFAYAFASLALPAKREDGSAAVLKIQFPDRESEYEAAALELMDGDGAVRLIAYDAGRRALLLERADPGTPLKELEPDRALDVLVDLLPRLWKPAGAPFRPLADEAAGWAGSLPDDYERCGPAVRAGALGRGARSDRDAQRVPGRAGVGEPGHACRQRHQGRARALAADRPEAACRGTGVRYRRDRPGPRVGTQPRGRRAPPRPTDHASCASTASGLEGGRSRKPSPGRSMATKPTPRTSRSRDGCGRLGR